MNRTFSILLAVTMCASLAAAAGKKLQIKDLPAAVQKTVSEQAKHAQIAHINKETEKGVTQFEIETLVNGKHRDFNVDTKGNLIAVEEETSLASIPAAARAAIEKRAAGARIAMVEAVTKGSSTAYEASFTPKGGKAKEVMVNADGSEAKE